MSSTEDDTRRMNDTTMPPPSQAGKTATSTGAPITSAAATSLTPSSSASKRQQKALRKGFGLAGWNKLLRTSNDLAQLQGKSASQKLRWSEIKRHNSVYDGWVVLRGKVFNISPYLAYHPGGESILRNVLGKDITALYDKYHRWVNEEGLIGKLRIGYLDTSRRPEAETKPSYLPAQISAKDGDGFAMPAPRPPKAAVATLSSSALASQDTSDEEEELWDNR